ncbi:hypothetical protein KDE12_01305 [Campylobacter sp. faydin G-105]|uniref:hypothetical protein n=1 Tax=Campylobacter anatolicus TaxID=2829105 RepID=UPI001BA2BEC2|nr:hypothetical protein [Campylobacter anatolicus]MBR8461489.1 hypothetical protein [Campylobacter anatolicus]
MAKITSKLREQILADYKAGLSQNKLAREYELSPASINKICKGVVQENAELVNKQVAINAELAEKSEAEVNAIHQLVAHRTKHLIYFQSRALANQKKADELLEYATDFSDIEAHSRVTARNKETVLGREPMTQINNTNAQQTNTTTNAEINLNLENLSDDELHTINAILEKTS